MINEFVYDPVSGSEWIEIYNNSTESLDINGWQIKKDSSDTGTILLSSTIPPAGYLSYPKTNWLSNTGGSIFILDAGGTQVDRVTYGNEGLSLITKGFSYGRYPNGTGDWKVYSTPSQGQPNQAPPTPTPTFTPTPTNTPSPTATPTPIPLEIQIVYLPGSIKVGEAFTVGFSASSLKTNTDYCVKAYGGLGSDNYGIVTQNGANWYDITTPCYLLPKFRSNQDGAISNNLTVKVKDGKDSGSYRLNLKIIEVNHTDISRQSSDSTITVIPASTPTPTPTAAHLTSPSPNDESLPSPSPSPTPPVFPSPDPSVSPLPGPESFLTPAQNGYPNVAGISDHISPADPPSSPSASFASIINIPLLLLIGGGILLLAPLAVNLVKHE